MTPSAGRAKPGGAARPGTKTGYIPTLDGWRAVAVMGVLIGHDSPWTVGRFSTGAYNQLGGLGVMIFFAISGFLITTRILEEEQLCGYFDIRRFYIRRVFRIQPAAWAYLAVIGLLMGLHVFHASWYYWTAALLLFINFLYHHSGVQAMVYVAHFWSLAVEEHFYLLLSLILLVVKRRRMLVLGLLYFLFWLPLHLNYAPHSLYRTDISPRSTQWNLYFLLLSSFAAVVLKRPGVLLFAKKYIRPWVVLAVTVIAIPLHHFIWHAGVSGAAFFVASYLSIFWIVATSLHPESLTSRVLESPVFRFVGRISYSLYLWHILIFFGSTVEAGSTSPIFVMLSGRVTKYVASFALATLSYYLIEKPMIRRGHRLAPAASPGRPELMDLPVEAPKAGFAVEADLADGGKSRG